jgi:hypothetical protein
MIGTLIFGLTILTGLALVRWLPIKLHLLERGWLSIIFGIIFTTWLLFGLAATMPNTLSLGTGLLLLVGVITFSLRFAHRQSSVELWSHRSEWLNYALYSLFWAVVLIPLFYTHMFQVKTDGLYSGGGSWGDLALHSSFIMMFSQQEQLSLQSPIFAQEATRYPFLINFYSAQLVRGGWSLSLALLIPGLLLALAFTQLLYVTAWRVTKSGLAPWVTSLLFLFNGGIGWWLFLQFGRLNTESWWTALKNVPVDYSLYPEHGLHWSNIISTYLLPQRGMVVGLSVVITTLLLFHEALSKKIAAQHRLGTLISLAILIGSLPFFHLHSFLVLVGLWIGLASWSLYLRQTSWKEWLGPTIILLALAAPQLTWQMSSSINQEYPTFVWGWLKEDQSFILFWLRNMGPAFALSLLAGGWLWWFGQKQSYLRVLFTLMSCCFLITNLLIFQPYHWDNMKLMLPSYLVFCLAIGWMMSQWWQNQWGKVMVLILLVASTLTGGLSILKESRTSWRIASHEDLALAQQLRALTPAQSVFLTADTHNHPVPMLAGRPVVMGYRGWLWTHGIDYQQTERDIKAIYSGQPNALGLLEKNGIKYVYVGQRERHAYRINESFLTEHFTVLLESHGEKVYQINPR